MAAADDRAEAEGAQGVLNLSEREGEERERETGAFKRERVWEGGRLRESSARCGQGAAAAAAA